MLRSSALRSRVPGTALGIATLLLACGADTATGPEPGDVPFDGALTVERADARAFTHVHVVDPATGTVRDDQVVLVRDGRIEAVGPSGSVAVPAGTDVVDGRGGWLMPGLVDMHVHMGAADAEAYVRSGITTVRNMWGYSTLGALAGAIDAGTRIGPTIRTLSSGLDGPPVHWPETQLITDPADADSVVQLQWDRGYRELKVYQDLSRPVYDAIVAAARARGMTFAGHKPTAVPLVHVIESGQRSIEHAGGYVGLGGSALDDAVASSVAHGTWNCPTLAIQAVLPGAAQGTDARRVIVKKLYDAGARLLIGTDAGIDVTAPGTSLADEIEEFRRAGLPLAALIRIATVDAAVYLGMGNEIGSIAVGYRADLVLLAADPLTNLDALRRPLGVNMLDRWIDMR